MKIILSRKGFDAACGGVASPILPDGALVSLPIPERASHVSTASRRYADIRVSPGDDHGGPGLTMGRLVDDLSRGAVRADTPAHLDPDLNPGAVSRRPGWRPMFGQTGAAERHLRNHHVGPGDLFLFFGWFRRVELERARAGRKPRFHYAPGAPDWHVLFGWQQIERRVSVTDLDAEESALPDWAAGHPHCDAGLPPRGVLDCVYLATERLRLPGLTAIDDAFQPPGGGVFSRFRPALCLSAAGATRSVWDLPAWFRPGPHRPALSYHGAAGRWEPSSPRTADHPRVRLDTAKQGQEFVLDVDRYPEAMAWVRGLFGDDWG